MKNVVLWFDIFECHKISGLAEIEPMPEQITSGIKALVSIVVETTSMLELTNRSGLNLITEFFLFVCKLKEIDRFGIMDAGGM